MLWKKYPDEFLRQEDWFGLINRPQKGAARAAPFLRHFSSYAGKPNR
jgi:hypothetical protein